MERHHDETHVVPPDGGLCPYRWPDGFVGAGLASCQLAERAKGWRIARQPLGITAIATSGTVTTTTTIGTATTGTMIGIATTGLTFTTTATGTAGGKGWRSGSVRAGTQIRKPCCV